MIQKRIGGQVKLLRQASSTAVILVRTSSETRPRSKNYVNTSDLTIMLLSI